MPKCLLWALAAVTAGLYAALAYGSYTTLPALAGGILGFDMRPLGMPYEVARPYVTDMPQAARDYYLGALSMLDTAFIACLVTLVVALAKRFGGRLIWLTAIAALCYAAADLIENRLVAILVALTLDVAVPEYFEAVTLATRLKFAALGVMTISLIVQWRQSDA